MISFDSDRLAKLIGLTQRDYPALRREDCEVGMNFPYCWLPDPRGTDHHRNLWIPFLLQYLRWPKVERLGLLYRITLADGTVWEGWNLTHGLIDLMEKHK